MTGISGSNDTTGKDCVSYGFRQCFYGQTAAAAIGPVLLKAIGKDKKAAYLTPDYTYGHTVQKSMEDYLGKNGGWTTVTNQVAPLGAPDYSSYLLNIANSGADILINVNWGHDAVLSIQQAKQFGILAKQKLVIPYQVPFLAREVGAQTDGRRLCRHRFLVDAGGQVSRWPRCSSRRSTRNTATSRNGAPTTPIWSSPCGRTPWSAPAPSIRRTSSRPRGRQQERLDRWRGLFPGRRSPVDPAGDHRARQEAPSA